MLFRLDFITFDNVPVGDLDKVSGVWLPADDPDDFDDPGGAGGAGGTGDAGGDYGSGTGCTALVYGSALVKGQAVRVLLRVTGFSPHLYYATPPRPSMEREFMESLGRYTGATHAGGLVTTHLHLKTLFGADPDFSGPSQGRERRKRPFTKVQFPTMKSYQKAKYATSNNKDRKPPIRGPPPHETMISPAKQFCDSCGVGFSDWAILAAGEFANDPISHADIELECDISDISPRPSTTPTPNLGHLVVSYDIETYTPRASEGVRSFPLASEQSDKIIVIASSLWWSNTPPSEALTVVQCLASTGAAGEGPPGVADDFCDSGSRKCIEVYACERDLLNAFGHLIGAVSPTFLSGYNTTGFDNAYIADRAALTGAEGMWTSLGLVPGIAGKRRDKVLNSSAKGENTLALIDANGLTTLDAFSYVKDSLKLTSYKLADVAKHVLGGDLDDETAKIELSYTDMMAYYEGGPLDRGRVAEYCAMDALLPIKILAKLQAVAISSEMSFVTKTSLDDILTRGQQIKVTNLLSSFCSNNGYIMSNIPPRHLAMEAGEGYVGATVLEPSRGYYTTPIACLDFASLYPSIMRANNLSYDTLIVDQSHIPRLRAVGVVVAEFNGVAFVQDDGMPGWEGVLPRCLKTLLDQRARVRREAKAIECVHTKAIMNGQQLAYKVSANSIYGFTGCGQKGVYPCARIASAVTFIGRGMIDDTKREVESKFDLPVIYGDTDSVFIDCGRLVVEGESDATTVARLTPLMEKCALQCTKLFRAPNDLEFEKIYLPFLIDNKKRYAGLMWGPSHTPVDPIGVDSKGLSLVRRDGAKYGRDVGTAAIEQLLVHKSPQGAVDIIKKASDKLADLQATTFGLTDWNQPVKIDYGGGFDIGEFVMTKSIKQISSYAADTLPHVRVVKQMEARHPGSAPRAGDRVPFIPLVSTQENAKLFERVDHPSHVVKEGIAIDFSHVLSAGIRKPMIDFLKWAVDEGDVERACAGGLLRIEAGNSRVRNSMMGVRPLNAFFTRSIDEKTRASGVFKSSRPAPAPPTPLAATKKRTLASFWGG
jgi:DNA polymerase elongation subunit (family B)